MNIYNTLRTLTPHPLRSVIRTVLGYKEPQRYRQIFAEIESIHPVRIMEIGTAGGKRGTEIVRAAMEYNPHIEYYGFDLFEALTDEQFAEELSKRPLTEQQVQEKLEATGAKVCLYAGNTRQTMPEVVSTMPKMDLVFIDGGHSIETIQSDWNNVEQVMDENTVVIFDDYWTNRTDAGCKPVVDAINTSKYNVQVLPIIDRFTNPHWGDLVIQLARVVQK